MSFFIKGKPKSGHNNKFERKTKGSKRKAPPKTVKHKEDDEVTSSEDEAAIHREESSEDELETPQEKKVKLAKVYLQEIEREERERREDNQQANTNGDVISKRLKEDYLRQAGKLKSNVADKYLGPDIDNVVVLKCKELHSAVTCLCVSPDGLSVFCGSKCGSLVKWSIPERRKIHTVPYVKKKIDDEESKHVSGHSAAIMSIAISFDSKFLAVGDDSKAIQVWCPDTLKHINTLTGHRNGVSGLVFRANTHTLYSCSRDKSVKVWSLDEMSYVETLYGHQDGIMAIDALSRERCVTAGGRDASVRIWKIAEESQLIYNGPPGSIDTIKLINEENFVSAGDDGQLNVWSAMKKKPLCSVKSAHGVDAVSAQPRWISAVTALLNTDLIASGSHDGFVRVWKLGEGFRTVEPLFTVPVAGFVNSISFTADGKFLVAGVGTEHRLGRWNVEKKAKNAVVLIPLLKNE